MPLHPDHKTAIDKFTSTDHTGKAIDSSSLLKPNHLVARVIAARAASLSDDERSALKSILTPQTSAVLQKMLPELSSIMNKGMNANG